MTNRLLRLLTFTLFITLAVSDLNAQQSVARRWNEVMLAAIREDFARPPITARILFHTSLGMYDAWAAYDNTAETYLLGKTVGNYNCPFNGVPAPTDVEEAREIAISYAAYRILRQRFIFSPNYFTSLTRFNNLMNELGLDPNFTDSDYENGNPAALGNYIGENVLLMGYSDGANELNNYATQLYAPVNPTLAVDQPGNPNILDPNRWQPLQLTTAVDQNGNPIPAIQKFQSPEWGRVRPFAMSDAELAVYNRDNVDYLVYHDPGAPPLLDTTAITPESEEYKWNFELVSAWSSHLDPSDGVMWDISPAGLGNNQGLPNTLAELHDFYDFANGGDAGTGRPLNPYTGQPYEPQIVPRGDYTRVLAQFWADGPNSETPPGHWYSILNKVNDNPALQKRFNGKGPVLGNLEWDVKVYFTLGGALHDAAVTAWGIKGWYDAVRPISALRYMADRGQSSDPNLPNYHPAGIQLIPGYIEMVEAGDPLAGDFGEHIGKIKLYTWAGFSEIQDPNTQFAGAGWILAERWTAYQRKTFVTPPFAGFISGHSTYSRSAAETLTLLTGDEYFPGGMEEYTIHANSGFLGLEQGPSVDVKLQWATYRDASDQTSLSRIWGGIHPPFDDIPGRKIGIIVGPAAYEKAKRYFYKDNDGDGFFSYEDCDDNNAAMYEGAAELCDGIDNDCNGLTDDGAPLTAIFADLDGDGYGNPGTQIDTCVLAIPGGFVLNGDDCDDTNPDIRPGAADVCDGIDNNCNGDIDENLPQYTYYPDNDGDGFGQTDAPLTTCQESLPTGYAIEAGDCDDGDSAVNPLAAEVCDSLDNNCNGQNNEGLPVYAYYADNDGDGFGNPTAPFLTCLTVVPPGFVLNVDDCDDTNADINPDAPELPTDGIDNNCNGLIDENSATSEVNIRVKVYPNPVSELLMFELENDGLYRVSIYSEAGQLVQEQSVAITGKKGNIDFSGRQPGLYFLRLQDESTLQAVMLRIVKM